MARNRNRKVAPVAQGEKDGLKRAVNKVRMMAEDTRPAAGSHPIKPPTIPAGVVPSGKSAPVMAMDLNPYTLTSDLFPGGGFPGYPYLSQLATRAEYRAFASTLSTELTREWIEFTSKQDDDTDTSDKIKQIEDEFKRLNVRGVIQKAAEHDCYFGRGQIFLTIKDADEESPLILDPRTIKKGSLSRLSPVEAIWTTPSGYGTIDPAAPDFYKPYKWFMLGREVHASRLMTVVTRPLPDMLKPAYNFSGMSLSQLAEPYVENWLRTRQSVSDLINNFSITVLATSMDQVLQGNDDGTDLFTRADLFTTGRSNKGLMLVDKEREEIVQVNTPLSGLHELQAQSQEHMCSVSRMPAIVLTGISPSGLNASSEGEIRAFYDWVSAQQESYWRDPVEIVLKAVQLSLFGEIDPDIGFTFVPLYQMTPAEEAAIRLQDSQADCAYVASGIIDPSEVRERLAKDPASGYQGLDTDMVIVPPTPPEGEEPPASLGAGDGEFEESKHPRGEGGQFGSGGASKKAAATKELGAAERNDIARSEVLFKKYGSKEEGGRGKFKEDARSGKLDHLHDEQKAIVAAAKESQKAAAKEKSDKWKSKNLPGLAAEKREREKAAAEEKAAAVGRAKNYAEAIASPDKTYLDVPYSMKDDAKGKGAFWDSNAKKWFVAGDVPDGLASYAKAKTEPAKSAGNEEPAASKPGGSRLPTSGRVHEDDPSIYGSWLLGHEGESWASVARHDPKRSTYDELPGDMMSTEEGWDDPDNYSDEE